MVGGVLLPAAALLADALRGGGLSDELRACAGGAVALLLAIPAYFLRRALPLPPWLFDAAAIAATLGAALATGALRRYVRLALSPTFRAAGWLVAGVVPSIVCLVWLGFEVSRAGAVRYYGLFTIDFSNLAGTAAMIKASPGMPEWVTAGGGSLHYHWWFFTIAAWLSGFAGSTGRVSSALVLSNLLSAVLLAATLCAFLAGHLRQRAPAAEALPERARDKLTVWSAAIVIVAPFSFYAYQFLIAHLHRSWLTLGFRNSLLLSIVNSMSTFGNNTLALALALLLGAALAAYRERPAWRLAGLIGLAGLSIVGLSITLSLPIMLAAGTWILLARVKQPWRLVVTVAVIGAAGLPLLRASSIIGDSSQHLVVSFDRGQFVQNIALGMAPVWILAVAGLLLHQRFFSFSSLLIAACVLVPTFIDLAGHGTTPSTMSMKIGSLLAVAAAPLVADGVLALMLGRVQALRAVTTHSPEYIPAGRTAWRAAAALALLVGLTNSLVYTLQFAVYRFTGRDGGRSNELPADYVQALSYVRRNTRADVVVVDPNSDLLREAIGTLLVAERQVWLPTRCSAEVFRVDIDNPEIMSRLDLWRAWESGHFSDEALAASIAGQADILVGPPHIQSASWEERHAVGPYAVYASRRRPGRAVMSPAPR